MTLVLVVGAAVLGYLIGSIPTGYVVVKFITGRDIRHHGSGRTGGTNALRAGGLGAGLLTMVGDALKGFVAVMLARLLAGQTAAASNVGALASALAGLGSVLGHNWSVYMGFKGGAGTGPNIGVSIAFWPLAGLYLVPLVPLGLYLIGYASVTSMAVAGAIVATFVVRAAVQADAHWWYAAYAVAAAVAVVWALRPNLKRLRDGAERKVGRRARAAQDSGGESS